jgi:GNAT superfamily N-acetyltransferase
VESGYARFRVSPADILLQVRPVRESDLPEDAADLRHAFATDPEGTFAVGAEGVPPEGLAAGVVRGELLQIVHLEVSRSARGRGVGAALFAAVRGYGASRGARGVEFMQGTDEVTLGFLLGLGLPVRGVAIRLRARTLRAGAGVPSLLVPVPSGAPFSGWVADLDRETRGFARTPDWAFWARRGSVLFSTRRRGRPEAIGALATSGRGAAVGPVAAATPEAAAGLLIALAAEAIRRGAGEVRVTTPAEARLLLEHVLGCGFRVEGTFPLLSTRARGDLRRYAASPTAFF